MKKIFKFAIIFLCLWVGTKSILQIGRGSDSFLDLILDLGIFIIFVGSPAATYWGNAIDKAFDEPDLEKENKNDEN